MSSVIKNSFAQGIGGGAMKSPIKGVGVVKGVVVSESDGKPIEYAMVSLIEPDFKKPLDGQVTNEKGQFKFLQVNKGKFKVAVTFLGYKPQELGVFKITDTEYEVNVGVVKLAEDIAILKGVEIVGQKDLIENKIDKIVYNAERDITSKGGNATDVLKKVPMVSVDLEGNVSLRGSQNVKVLINGKPSNIMSSSIADAMKMIPADNIEKVEVITQPSAKDDAEGTGGIINIITKKKNIEGVSGSIYAGAGTRSSNLGSSITFRSGKFGINANIGGYYWRGKGNQVTSRSANYDGITTYLNQEGPNSNQGGGLYAQIGSDYDINEHNNLSMSLRLNRHQNVSYSNYTTSLSADDISYIELFRRDGDFDFKMLGYDASLDFKRTFKKKDQEFTSSFQFNNNNRNQDYSVDQYVPTTLNELLNYVEKSTNLSQNKEITLQADYVHPFNDKTTFETGAKSIIRTVISDYAFDTLNIDNQQYIRDLVRSNVFNYNQLVVAGYAQISVYLNKAWGIKAGTRYEHTTLDGNDRDNTIPSFSNQYGNFIPNVVLSYKIKDKNTIKASYTQRIQRPSIFFLNPYRNELDPTNVSYGNPKLNAELSHSWELSYGFNKEATSINISAFHRRTNNAIESYKFVDDANILSTTYGNIGKNSTTGLSINANTFFKGKVMLSANMNIAYYQVSTNASSALLTGSKNDGLNYNINLFGNYNFIENWGVTVFGNWNSPKISLQGKQTSFFYYSLGIRRELWKKKGGISFGVDNPFTPQINFKNEYKGTDFSLISNNKINFIGVRLNFDYRFGKMDFNNGNGKKKGIKNDDLKQGEDGGMNMKGN